MPLSKRRQEQKVVRLDPPPRYDDLFFEHANRMNGVEEAINRGTVDCCVEIEDVFPPLVSAANLVNCPDGRYRDR